MTDFDLIVIGGGTANSVASRAANAGLETALVEKGPLGGTCLNRGCNPSKTLIQHANRLNEIRDSGTFHIDATVSDVDFGGLVGETTAMLGELASAKENELREQDNLTLIEEEVHFVGEREISTGSETYAGEKVLVAAGTRPTVPGAISGLHDVDYLTSDDAVRLERQSESLVILGGGYIAAELGYFYESMGTRVTIIESGEVLLKREDREVADAFTEIARQRHDIYTGYRVTRVEEGGDGVEVTAEAESGEEISTTAEEVLVALGRRPNTDTLDVEAAGIATDDRGFVETNEYLETSAENVWATGDIAGNYQFKHTGDYEARVVADNAIGEKRRAVDFTGVTHAVFTEPQIGEVGEIEADLRERGTEYVVGRADFVDTAMARALKLEGGFVKVLADPGSGEVLGCHAIGHEAATLIHEATIAVRHGLGVREMADTIHVHPAMNKVMEKAFRDAAERVEGGDAN